VIDDATRRFPESPGVRALDALVWYADGRRDRAREIANVMMMSSGATRALGFITAANLDLLEGRFTLWSQSADSLAAMNRGPDLGSQRIRAEFWVRGRQERAAAMLDSTLAKYPAFRASLEAAELYALLNRPDSARAALRLRGTPDLTVYGHGTDTLPTAAWIDFHEGRPRDAVAKFRGSLRFSGAGLPSQTLRDAEVGFAFERAGLPDSAIASYEHYLQGTPMLELDAYKLVQVLEHVARLYEVKGDRRKAAAAYRRVAELWKNADAELQPRVRVARERASSLPR
jgi:tetratricopeptide (TPR) repeat protein